MKTNKQNGPDELTTYNKNQPAAVSDRPTSDNLSAELSPAGKPEEELSTPNEPVGPHPDVRIVKFIRRHHVMTLATCRNGQSWCSNMFYAYLPESNIFVFTSEEHTRHIREAQANPMASGSIVLETRTVGRLQGLQFSGIVRTPLPQEQRTARNAYLKRFPYAAVAELTLWIFAPIEMKFTDNTLGFGKKLHWKESVPVKND